LGLIWFDHMFENVKSDIKRFDSGGEITFRAFVRGLLSQGFQAVLVYRFFNWLLRSGLPGQPLRFFVERFIEITTGISIPAECKIGKGFRIHHFGGIIFHPATVVGENCTIYQGVTFGDKGGYGGAPILGDNVIVGAGAKIVGEVTVGNNCKIGALAVVSDNVPDNSRVVCAKPIVLIGVEESKE